MLTCAELDSASNRHLLMRAVATLCALAGFDSEFYIHLTLRFCGIGSQIKILIRKIKVMGWVKKC